MIASVDLGFGYTKAVGIGTEWRQPSIVGEPRQLFDNSIKPDDVQIGVGGKHYFIGDLALRHSIVNYFSTGENKADTWTTKILLLAALGAVSPTNTIHLVTGLPVDYYFKQKQDFEKLLHEVNTCGEYVTQIGNQKASCRPYITNYKIVPQPFGSAMNYLLDDKGQICRPTAAQGSILVIDIGYYTLDLLALDRMEISKQSHSPEHLGIDTAYTLIQQALRERFGRAPNRQDLDQYVRSGVYEGVNIVPIRQQAFKALARQIKSEVDSLNTKFDRYIVTGGWAFEIAPMLCLPMESTTIYDGTGNVKGYQKIGVRLWQKSSVGSAQVKTATL